MADNAVTISKTRVFPLSENERVNSFTHKFKVLYSDINVAAATGSTDTVTLTLATTPDRWVVDAAQINVTTAFAGTGGFAAALGTSGASTAFIGNTSVMTAGLIQPTYGSNTVNTPGSSTSTASTTLKAVFTNSVGSSPSVLSAGALDIYLSLKNCDKMG